MLGIQDNWKIFQFRIQQVKTVNCFLLFLKKSILNLPGTDSLIHTPLYYRLCTTECVLKDIKTVIKLMKSSFVS